METPSSTRRLTRSQAMAAAAANTTTVVSKKFEESEKKAAKSRNGGEQERSALFDITNDSPIVGVAMGSLETPSSAMSKKRAIINAVSKQLKTPGSGEALLRDQVKTLLQKVEEEAELSKLSVEYRPFFLHLKGVVNNSPTGLLAPTPANTPHLSLSGNNGLPSSSFTPSPVEEKFLIPQMVDGICDWKKEGESEKSMVTRTLFLDFTEKLESEDKEKTTPVADDESVWSIQVNASSSISEEEDYEGEEEGEEECDEYYEEEEVCDGGLVDEVCEGTSKMSVKFSGKHTRFVYNSDGELEGVVVEDKAASLCI